MCRLAIMEKEMNKCPYCGAVTFVKRVLEEYPSVKQYVNNYPHRIPIINGQFDCCTECFFPAQFEYDFISMAFMKQDAESKPLGPKGQIHE
jgi:hypothetical protein